MKAYSKRNESINWKEAISLPFYNLESLAGDYSTLR
jgi:hypothetical protein